MTQNPTPSVPPAHQPPPIDPGLLGSLFDMSFKTFVTPKLIQIIFVILVVLAALGTLTLVISTFTQSVLGGVFVLLLSPVIFLLYVLGARIWLELVIVAFRIYELLRDRGGAV